jgi:hypothetical protein
MYMQTLILYKVGIYNESDTYIHAYIHVYDIYVYMCRFKETYIHT